MEYIHYELGSHRFPVHFHDTFVIQQVLAGSDWCCQTNLLAETGEVYVHFPFAAHTGGTLDAQQLVYRAIYPDQNTVCRLTGIDSSEIPVGESMVSRDRMLCRAVSDLFHRCEKGLDSTGDENALRNVFELVLSEHRATGTVDSGTSSSYEKMLCARNYLLDNFRRDVTSEELSDACDLSPFHMIRSFRRQFGITPRQFLISHRISMAKRQIRSGSSVAAAAYSTGFADQSHLNRYFKKFMNYNPRQLKKT
jgi:AraC-like DNA-binding protein